ncbi:thiopurine S-methyltransferase [Thiorhodococcus fuscus]|uniref:thiopurine S-methyltransferase n=1 Tax=Thiorhodococcus fuscus TaxID=527200 RepID=A0ABW4YB86_9GAMM
MTNRDNALWKQYWRDQRTDLSQQGVNPLLTRWWSSLELEKDIRVLVPMCGKSQDMLWLIKEGYRVTGIELSPVAVRAFFLEHDLGSTKRIQGPLTRWGHGNLSILCGDFFAVTAADLGPIDAIYDCAALTALPEDIRRIYVTHLALIAPDVRQLLVLTSEDSVPGESLGQISTVAQEIQTLYAERFNIDLAQVETHVETDRQCPQELGETVHHKAYRMTARAPALLIAHPDSASGEDRMTAERTC